MTPRAVNLTMVQDTVTYADGSVASGKIVVTWPPFVSLNTTIVGGQAAYDIAADGTISIPLFPTPTGIYYTAAYELDKGPVYEEYWEVPPVPNPTTIGAIRTIPGMPGTQ